MTIGVKRVCSTGAEETEGPGGGAIAPLFFSDTLPYSYSNYSATPSSIHPDAFGINIQINN